MPVQDCSDFIANVLEIMQSYTKPLRYLIKNQDILMASSITYIFNT